jgi:predicted exporter
MTERINASLVAAVSWLILVIVVALLALKQGPLFDTSIFALLPESDQSVLVKNSTEQMAERYARRLVILLTGGDDNEVRQAVSNLAQKLSGVVGVSRMLWQVEANQVQQFHDELFPYRFAVLDQGVRRALQAQDFQSIADGALLRLYSILSIGQSSIIDDPFGLYTQSASSQSSELNLQVSRSMLKVSGMERPSYVIMLTLSGDPFSPGLQQSLLTVIEEEKGELALSDITIKMSGLLLHAAAGARQATQEISTIGVGSLLGIVILVSLIFRRFKPLLLMLFPVFIGCITAASVTLLVFGRVHLVTFAFGAGLVGVSIDYALHFLCERRVSAANQVLKRVMPGLMLGLFSSVMAYAAQSLTPFPGLRQMALFSVVGLSAAWLTVVLWFPTLTSSEVIQPLPSAAKLNALRHWFPRLENNPVLMVLMVLATLLSIYSLWGTQNHEDIRLLQTSPEALIKQEQAVQKMMGLSSSAQFFLINADSLEQCLRIEEQLIPKLNMLKKNGQLEGYLALSMRLPSLNQQAQNVALVNQLYQQKLDPFFQKLKIADSKLAEAQLSFNQIKKDRLTADVWLQQKGSDSWRDLIVDNAEHSAATVIRLNGLLSDEVKQSFVSLAKTTPGIHYIDQTKNISELMEKYRAEVVTWVSLAYLFVFCVLLLRYKLQVWRIILPPLLASLFTLAVLVQLEQGINLFHLMALILVLGIGLDMGIFLAETAEASHTWLAVSLSAYTSLLAFGLLALSKTPVLHHFGLTVLLGLCFVWLLVPVMRKYTAGEFSV